MQAIATLVLLTALASATASHAQTAPAPDGSAEAGKPRQLTIANKPWKGDFDAMLERRMIRVDAPFSRSLYHNDKGRERGLAVELVRDWERYINVKYVKQLGKRPLTIYISPATRDKLLPDLNDGLADVSIGNQTVTEERLKTVDFIPGDDGRRMITEVIVTGPKSPELKSLNDLSGKTVHVRQASSYYDSLQKLNERLKSESKPQVRLVLVPDALEDEDMMEMLDTGLLELIVVDDWKARMWAQVLPKIKVRNDLVLRPEAKTGWAIRKDSPKLAAEIDDFFRNWAIKQGVAAYRMNRYMKIVKELKDPTASAEYKRFRETLALFEKYGNKYGFDPLMLAAPGLPGIAAQPEREKPCRSDRRDAAHAGDRRANESGGCSPHRAEHPRRRQVHGSLDDQVCPGCEVQRRQSPAVRVRELQLRSRKRVEGTQGSRETRSRPGQVVQQRRARGCREDRYRDDNLRS